MKYDKLYLDILKVGIDRLNTGLSYNDLKSDLSDKGYDLENDCIELAVKQWFFDCFHHKSEHALNGIADLEEHLDCNFVLKGDSSLALIEHNTSKRNLWIAYAALFISLLSLFYPIFSKSETESLTSTKELQQTQSKKQARSQTFEECQDSATKSLPTLYSSCRSAYFRCPI